MIYRWHQCVECGIDFLMLESECACTLSHWDMCEECRERDYDTREDATPSFGDVLRAGVRHDVR
jgi:hypothetical protein